MKVLPFPSVPPICRRSPYLQLHLGSSMPGLSCLADISPRAFFNPIRLLIFPSTLPGSTLTFWVTLSPLPRNILTVYAEGRGRSTQWLRHISHGLRDRPIWDNTFPALTGYTPSSVINAGGVPLHSSMTAGSYSINVEVNYDYNDCATQVTKGRLFLPQSLLFY